MKTKQVIILRNDLNMRKGKLASQAAHASLAIITQNLNVISSNGETHGEFPISDVFLDWLNNSYTKICLQCNSEQELLELYSKAKEANIPCSLIKDNGTTEFNGVKTYTAAAIGPDECEKIDVITKNLKLW